MRQIQEPAVCENCLYYEYNEEMARYECTAGFDQDEAQNVPSGYPGETNRRNCPYFHTNDEYKTVMKQN